MKLVVPICVSEGKLSIAYVFQNNETGDIYVVDKDISHEVVEHTIAGQGFVDFLESRTIHMAKLASGGELGDFLPYPVTDSLYETIKRNIEGEMFDLDMVVKDGSEACPEPQKLTIMSLDFVKEELSKYRC